MWRVYVEWKLSFGTMHAKGILIPDQKNLGLKSGIQHLEASTWNPELNRWTELLESGIYGRGLRTPWTWNPECRARNRVLRPSWITLHGTTEHFPAVWLPTNLNALKFTFLLSERCQAYLRFGNLNALGLYLRFCNLNAFKLISVFCKLVRFWCNGQ